MKIHILAILLTLSFFSVLAIEDVSSSKVNDDDDGIVNLSFLVEYEPDEENDHIQIGFTVETRDRSLKKAQKEAEAIIENIEEVAETFCEKNPEEGVNCDEIVDVQDFEIEAEFTKKKGQTVQQFIVSHDVTISVHKTEKIGEFVDKLLKKQPIQIESFQWASDEEEDADEEVIETGKQKAENLCYHLGMKLHRIVSITEVDQDQDNVDEDEEDDEDYDYQEDEDDELLVYRFEVECIPDAEAQARKNQQELQEDQREAENDSQDTQEERNKSTTKNASNHASGHIEQNDL